MKVTLFILLVLCVLCINARPLALPFTYPKLGGGVSWTLSNSNFGTGVTRIGISSEIFDVPTLFSETTTFEGNTEKFGTLIRTIDPNGPGNSISSYFFSLEFPVVRFIQTVTSESSESFTTTFNSDEFSTIVATSSGDLTFDTTDTWFVTELNDQYYDRQIYILHFLGHPGFLNLASTSQTPLGGDENLYAWDVDVTLAADETKKYMFFGYVSLDVNDAIAATSLFDTSVIDPELLSDLPQSAIDEIQNFDLAVASANVPAAFPHSNLCKIASEVTDRASNFRGNRKHQFSQPWFCQLIVLINQFSTHFNIKKKKKKKKKKKQIGKAKV
eukprot:TRINITY_DN105393_c0_g1_i2.p1 TRINITY_DN105393_c0_g1~~TRINITY_DN105393_c0_g1_i2.p1  ORF type:complete len:368 (-),score=15.14 TRINITY_DN105393_c0_g1_i2:13-999(-)